MPKNSNIAVFLLPLFWLLVLCCVFIPTIGFAQGVQLTSPSYRSSICDWDPENIPAARITVGENMDGIRCTDNCASDEGRKQYKCIQQYVIHPFGGMKIHEDITVAKNDSGKSYIRTSVSGQEKWVATPNNLEDPKIIAKDWFLHYTPTGKDKNTILTWYNRAEFCTTGGQSLPYTKGIPINPTTDIIHVKYRDVYPGFTNKIVTCIKEVLIGLDSNKQYKALFETCLRADNCKSCSNTPTPACYAERAQCHDNCRTTASTKYNQYLTKPDAFSNETTVFVTAFTNIHIAAKNIVSVCLVLYIIFFSIRMMFGAVQNLKSEGMVIILTLLLVTYFVMIPKNLESYALAAISIQEEFIDVTTRSIGDAPDAGQKRLCIETRNGVPYSLWQRLDCMMAHTMGAFPFIPTGSEVNQFLNEFGGGAVGGHILRTENISIKSVGGVPQFFTENGTFTFQDMAEDPYTMGENVTLVLLVAMAGMLMTPVGPFLVISGGFIPVLMLAAIAQALVAYLTSLIALIFLCMISPLIIPLCLFKATKQIFESWLQMVMGFMIQPAVLFAYLTFMVHVMEIILGSSLYEQYKMIAPNFVNENGIEVKDEKYAHHLRPLFEVFMPLETGKTGETGTLGQKDKHALRGSYVVPDMKFIDNSDQIRILKEENTYIQTIIDNLGEQLNAKAGNCTNANPDGPVKTICDQLRDNTDQTSENNKFIAQLQEAEDKHNKELMMLFLQSLITVGLILAITFGFLTNVMNFGAQLTGLYVPVSSTALNVYNEAMRRMSASMQQKNKKE